MNPITAPITGRQPAHCEHHGPYESFTIGGHRAMCPACYRADVEQRRVADLAKYRIERQRERAEHMLAIANIPPRFKNAALSDCDDRVRGRLGAYAENVPQRAGGLLVRGSVGTGKTHAACALIRAVCEAGYHARYCRSFDIAARIKATWGTRDSEAEAMDYFRTPRLLVIDEAGMGTPTDSDRERLHDLLDWRYSESLPTALVSNLDGEALRKYLGERGADRMREGLTVVTMAGESRRGPAVQS